MIIAPAYEPGAVDVLARKKNIRVLVASEPLGGTTEFRQISGGLLVQQRDALDADGDDPINWTLATGDAADPATLADLVFAWRTCRAVKSNAIVIARRRRHRRRRHGTGEPRRRGAAGGRARR